MNKSMCIYYNNGQDKEFGNVWNQYRICVYIIRCSLCLFPSYIYFQNKRLLQITIFFLLFDGESRWWHWVSNRSLVRFVSDPALTAAALGAFLKWQRRWFCASDDDTSYRLSPLLSCLVANKSPTTDVLYLQRQLVYSIDREYQKQSLSLCVCVAPFCCAIIIVPPTNPPAAIIIHFKCAGRIYYLVSWPFTSL